MSPKGKKKSKRTENEDSLANPSERTVDKSGNKQPAQFQKDSLTPETHKPSSSLEVSAHKPVIPELKKKLAQLDAQLASAQAAKASSSRKAETADRIKDENKNSSAPENGKPQRE